MKPFAIDPDMLTAAGVFYPTGHIVAMFERREQAEQVGSDLGTAGFGRDDLALMSPDVILRDICRTAADGDNPLPSVGTEGATVRAYGELALKDHWGLLIRADDKDEVQRAMDIVWKTPPVLAQRYRTLVIEDLEP